MIYFIAKDQYAIFSELSSEAPVSNLFKIFVIKFDNSRNNYITHYYYNFFWFTLFKIHNYFVVIYYDFRFLAILNHHFYIQMIIYKNKIYLLILFTIIAQFEKEICLIYLNRLYCWYCWIFWSFQWVIYNHHWDIDINTRFCKHKYPCLIKIAWKYKKLQ